MRLSVWIHGRVYVKARVLTRVQLLAEVRKSKVDYCCNPSLLQVANFEDWGQEPVPGEEMTISMDEYIDFNMNLQYFVTVKTMGKKFDEKEAEHNARVEWDFDRKGKDCLNRRDFTQCVFQMADAWAEEITTGAKRERNNYNAYFFGYLSLPIPCR